MSRSGGLVAMLAVMMREEMASMFVINGFVIGSNMKPTPAASRLRNILPLPLPLFIIGMVMCSSSLEEKYVV